jgi:hypothetical protein
LSCLWAACGSAQTGDNGDPCKDFELDVKKVWNAEIKLKVDIAIKQFGGEGGAGRSEEVATQMDNVTRDWVMLRESACRDHFKRQLITAKEYKAKVSCFDAFLQSLRTLITTIEGGDAAAVQEAQSASTELDQCR